MREQPAEPLTTDGEAKSLTRVQFLRRAGAFGLTMTGAASVLAACGSDTDGGPSPSARKVQKTLRIGTDFDITNLDPAFWTGHADDQIMVNVYEGLVQYKPGTWEVANVLAESFEPSSDGLRYEFRLKKGIPFHGGYGEMTAEDVKFSYERLADPKLKSPYAGDWAALDRVKVTGKHSGVIILKQPFGPLMRTTLPLSSGYVLSKKAVEQRGKKYAMNPIGTGSYEFVNWTPKQKIVLRRFEEYGGAATGPFPEPAWETIESVVINDTSAAQTALQAGDVHFARISNAASDRFGGDSGYTVEKRNALDSYFITMNVQHPTLRDPKVREAVRLAVDVDAINAAAYENKATRANAIIPENMGLGYWADAPRRQRDVEGAKALLREAGVDKLRLRFDLPKGEENRTVGEVVQANLADVGIAVDLHVNEEGTQANIGFGKRGRAETQLIYYTLTTQPDPYWSMIWFTCDQVEVWNWSQWCDPRYDKLMKAGTRATDAQARSAAYVQAQQLMDEAASMVYLVYPSFFFAARSGIKPAITPHGKVLPKAFERV